MSVTVDGMVSSVTTAPVKAELPIIDKPSLSVIDARLEHWPNANSGIVANGAPVRLSDLIPDIWKAPLPNVFKPDSVTSMAKALHS